MDKYLCKSTIYTERKISSGIQQTTNLSIPSFEIKFIIIIALSMFPLFNSNLYFMHINFPYLSLELSHQWAHPARVETSFFLHILVM